jgi:putative ABC transport system permease protein
METLVQDLRFALRSLRKNPGFSSLAVLTLGLGIGAATAIFSVADGVLLEPLPYGDPDGVVTVWSSWDNFPDKSWLSVPEFQLFHQENRALEDMALYQRGTATFTSIENPEQVGASFVTPNTFSVLGVRPVEGRTATWEEARDSVPPVLLGYDAWQRRWDGDPTVVGSTVEIDGRLMPVVGVLPQGFVLPVDYASPSVSEVFFPLYVDIESPALDLGRGGSHGAYGVGRLKDGQTVEDGRSDLLRVMAQVEPVGLYSPERRFTPRVFAAKDDVVGGAKGTIFLLLGAVGLVLLIACGNVANLLLTRSEGRVREMTVRAAVGAGRTRILRQLLTESGVLAILGGALGVGLASVGVRALLSVDPDAVPRSASVSIDLSVLLFALAVSIVTALIFGALPAMRVARAGSAASLHQSGRGAGAVSTRMQGLLVAFQMAMAVVLLTASGLMIRTFVSLLEVDPGFHPENVLTLRVTAPTSTYPDTEAVVEFYEELLRRVREIPGVEEAGAARLLPLASTMGDAGVRVAGYVSAPDESMQAEWQWATPGYLEVMGIPLLAGRTFDRRDGIGGREVIIVNESMARRYWGDRDPIGDMVQVFSEEAVVVGVVGDVAHNDLTGSVKERFYRPHAQLEGFSQRSKTLAIATRGPPMRALGPVREVVRGMDPSMPLAEIQTMDQVLYGSVAQPRFAMVLLAAFAIIALTLAIVGIYGVISYAVSRRTQEIGIRMALGAESRDVMGLMIRQGMIMALLGVVTGVGLALSLGRLMGGILYGVQPQDPVTFTAVPALFVLVALVACWIPAARATRVDPATALRYE